MTNAQFYREYVKIYQDIGIYAVRQKAAEWRTAMNFAELLKEYMNLTNLNVGTLAEVSGISASSVSRYINGKQTPGSETIRKLAAALSHESSKSICENSAGKTSEYTSGNAVVKTSENAFTNTKENDSEKTSENESRLTEEAIYNALQNAASGISVDYASCIQNLEQILSMLEISNKELADLLSYDPSYISRVLAGTRKPANLSQFLTAIADYIGRRFSGTPQGESIMKLADETLSATDFSDTDHSAEYFSDADHSAEYFSDTDHPAEYFSDADHYHAVAPTPSAADLSAAVMSYLGKEHSREKPQLASFLSKLDEFDLNEFMASIHFDEIKVPTLPFQLPTVKTYQGIQEMMQAELDFMKSVVLSKSTDDVIFYSDMPMEQMSRDAEFPKKWMMGLAMMLRKGLTLQIIHDVHRPLNEMLLGLEGWIPMYMTGQVMPYYLREQTNQHFMHFIRSAGNAAISGEAIYGKQENGRYVVSRNAGDVAYYRTRAFDLLNRAVPLMQIYRQEKMNLFQLKMDEIRNHENQFIHIGSAPPLFTMSAELLSEILSESNLSAAEKNAVKNWHAAQVKQADKNLSSKAEKDTVTYHFHLQRFANSANKENHENNEKKESNENETYRQVRLAISELILSNDLCYSEKTYLSHLKETEAYANTHENFVLTSEEITAFRNIDICICPGKHVRVSKCNAPTIHFLIYHPKMVKAFEEFLPYGAGQFS